MSYIIFDNGLKKDKNRHLEKLNVRQNTREVMSHRFHRFPQNIILNKNIIIIKKNKVLVKCLIQKDKSKQTNCSVFGLLNNFQ